MSEVKPVAWTARSWLANRDGGHFVQQKRQAFDMPLYDQSALDAAVAAERERCARLCEDWGTYDDGDGNVFEHEVPETAAYCAQMIRKS